jgi:exonuclease III
VHLINAYFPSGTTGEGRQTFKYAWLDEFFNYLGELKNKYPKMILCGDYNIAHREIDITIRRGMPKLPAFCLMRELGWTNSLLMDGPIFFALIIPSHIAIAGGASAFLVCGKVIRDGGLTTST